MYIHFGLAVFFSCVYFFFLVLVLVISFFFFFISLANQCKSFQYNVWLTFQCRWWIIIVCMFFFKFYSFRHGIRWNIFLLVWSLRFVCYDWKESFAVFFFADGKRWARERAAKGNSIWFNECEINNFQWCAVSFSIHNGVAHRKRSAKNGEKRNLTSLCVKCIGKNNKINSYLISFYVFVVLAFFASYFLFSVRDSTSSRHTGIWGIGIHKCCTRGHTVSHLFSSDY